MQVILIKTSGAKGELIEFLCLDINMLEILDLIQPDLQRKSGPRCLLLPVKSRRQPCRVVISNFLHDQSIHGKLWKNMQSLLHVVHLDEGAKG